MSSHIEKVIMKLLGLFFFLFFLNSNASAVKFYTNPVETVDSTGSVGRYTSIALDNSNNAYISYKDNSNGDVKFATNASGSWVTQTVESTGTVGSYTSLALDGSNNAYISYRDDFNANLKYATNASGSWVPQTVDSTGNVGLWTSLALDGTNAYISYYDFSNDDLKYATNASGSWVPQTVDSTGIVGNYTSLALDGTNAYISYLDGTPDNDLKYATNASGTWATETVDSTGNVGEFTSIALDNSNNAYISYRDFSNSDLKFATNASGSWVPQTVDSTGSLGLFGTSIALDGSSKAYISYKDTSNNDLKFATNATGTFGTMAATILTVDSTGDVGLESSIALDSTGKAYISYYDSSNGDLKFVTVEAGNLLSGQTNNVDLEGGSGTSGGVSASLVATADGRLVFGEASGMETDFTITSLVGDVYSLLSLSIDDATFDLPNSTLTFNIEEALANDAFIATGLSASALHIYHNTGSGIEQLVEVSRTGTTITVIPTGFSDFAIGVQPEPATLLLLSLALFGLAPLRKKLF